VGSRVFLKAVELVELASDRKVGDEMVGVLFFAGLEGGIDGEGVGAGKGVVSLSDLRRVWRGEGKRRSIISKLVTLVEDLFA
jgi:hypothetical protein